MKPKDMKNMTPEELKHNLKDLRAKLSQLSFDLGANTLKDTSQIKKVKKDVARILTELKNK